LVIDITFDTDPFRIEWVPDIVTDENETVPYRY